MVPPFPFPPGASRGGRVPPTPPERRLPPQEGFQTAPLQSALCIPLRYDGRMLPDFPHSKDQIRHRISLGIYYAARAKAPLLAEIKTIVQHEGKIHAYDRIRAAPVTEGYEQLGIPVTIELAEIPELVGERLAAKVDAIAEQMASKEMELFYRKQSQACEEVGNAVDAKGAPLTADILLDMLERTDMEFGPDNQPLGRFVVGPSGADRLQALQEDPDFQVRYKELVERKHDAWRDRESNRKLVD